MYPESHSFIYLFIHSFIHAFGRFVFARSNSKDSHERHALRNTSVFDGDARKIPVKI